MGARVVVSPTRDDIKEALMDGSDKDKDADE